MDAGAISGATLVVKSESPNAISDLSAAYCSSKMSFVVDPFAYSDGIRTPARRENGQRYERKADTDSDRNPDRGKQRQTTFWQENRDSAAWPGPCHYP